MMQPKPNPPPGTLKSGTLDFYVVTLNWLLELGILRRDMKILVLCGGYHDREAFLQTGFRDVTISNLDPQMKDDAYAPFAASRQDTEAITFPDDSFDFCIAHNGLHHCYSPHRGLLEMYRVAKTGVLVFEPRDSFITRLAVKLNFGQEYETAAVAANRCVAGGVRDTPVPNYVYRWSEREIEKTIRSFSPWGEPRFIYRHGLRVPWERLRAMHNRAFYFLARAVLPLLQFFFLCVPKQANGFAFVVLKPQIPRDLYPWLKLEDGKPAPNTDWLRQQYDFNETPESK